jgi:hypothetical protein
MPRRLVVGWPDLIEGRYMFYIGKSEVLCQLQLLP